MKVAGVVVPVLYLAWWADRLDTQTWPQGGSLLSLTAILACVLLYVAKEA